jgi:hypothetical protein
VKLGHSQEELIFKLFGPIQGDFSISEKKYVANPYFVENLMHLQRQVQGRQWEYLVDKVMNQNSQWHIEWARQLAESLATSD